MKPDTPLSIKATNRLSQSKMPGMVCRWSIRQCFAQNSLHGFSTTLCMRLRSPPRRGSASALADAETFGAQKTAWCEDTPDWVTYDTASQGVDIDLNEVEVVAG